MQFTIVAFITALVACVAATPSPLTAPRRCIDDTDCHTGQRCDIAINGGSGHCVDE
ncbi:hypothetical protein QVD99_003345 [Batrachochytrium dendrobatidis]|nr:hypothetical protein O5D80_005495 [Batrachochytrium dendrobatidis]KAK5669631.1 hypothetical protein QVD99_004021 [Batrachochytrium dendrobatidis]KAK5670198.1 hypothetical protein QVD99_003345 [Batrachochytrium dendrobatidis]